MAKQLKTFRDKSTRKQASQSIDSGWRREVRLQDERRAREQATPNGHFTWPLAYQWFGQENSPELASHDVFVMGMIEYERVRSFIAQEMKRTEPEREQRMLNAIEITDRHTDATTVEAFVSDVLLRVRELKWAISKAEVEMYVMAYLWKQLTEARAEIAKFPERMRKRRNGRDN